MALSETQIDTVFEILNLPRSSSIERPTGEMGLTGTTYTESNEDFQLQLKIESRISLLASGQQTKLITYIDRWEYIGTQMWVMESGSVGSTSGMSISPQDELKEITRRVERLCGVYESINEIKMLNTRKATIIPILN